VLVVLPPLPAVLEEAELGVEPEEPELAEEPELGAEVLAALVPEPPEQALSIRQSPAAAMAAAP
jgi:hypothetical protein